MMDKIEIDISKIRDTVTLYKSCRTELEEMLKDLNTSIENLKANWEGEAQKSFFENHFPTFSDSVAKHIKMIAFLEGELQSTANDFQDLDRELRAKLL